MKKQEVFQQIRLHTPKGIKEKAELKRG